MAELLVEDISTDRDEQAVTVPSIEPTALIVLGGRIPDGSS
ncbi:hypothetical protein AB0C86_37995 [Streptomyces lavendulae]